MARKPRVPRRTSRTLDASADSNPTTTLLPPDVEQRLREEFEALIRRMQSPESTAAYDQLSHMSGEDVSDFFRSQRGQPKEPDATSGIEPPTSASFIPLSRAEELEYPCVVMASLNYFATGEGHLLGLMIIAASSATDLQEEARRIWGEYHAQGVEIRPWSDLSDEGALLPTEPARNVLTRSIFRPSAFRYVSSLHVNYA